MRDEIKKKNNQKYFLKPFTSLQNKKELIQLRILTIEFNVRLKFSF